MSEPVLSQKCANMECGNVADCDLYDVGKPLIIFCPDCFVDIDIRAFGFCLFNIDTDTYKFCYWRCSHCPLYRGRGIECNCTSRDINYCDCSPTNHDPECDDKLCPNREKKGTIITDACGVCGDMCCYHHDNYYLCPWSLAD